MKIRVGSLYRHALGDFEQDCSAGDYLVDVGADAPVCVSQADAIQLSHSGGVIVGRVGSSPAPAVPRATAPASPGAPASVPRAAGGFVQTLESTTGISGMGLAIGLLIAMTVLKRK